MRDGNSGVFVGGDYDSYALEVRSGLMGSAQMLMVPEEHGDGKQLLRFSIRSHISRWGLTLIVIFSVFGVLAAVDSAWFVSAVLIGFAAVFALRARFEATTSARVFWAAFSSLQEKAGNDA